jgi:flagellar hook-associated protein 2
MSGLISAGGLITGLDSNSIIQQLLALEQGPIIRAEQRIARLEQERNTVRDLRTQLLTLRNSVQDFRLNNIFNAFQSTSNEESVLTAQVSSSNPVSGSFDIDVTQLASATVANSSAVLGSPIDPNATLDSSGITTEIEAGTFSINGVQFTVDPATDSLNDIINDINGSAAGVTATYNAVDDTLTIANSTGGDTSLINFGADGDDSNFLDAVVLSDATQATVGTVTSVTSTRNLGAIDATELLNANSFANGAVTAGSFSINGVSITVDPTNDSILDVIERINGSDARVSASYDTSTDSIRVVSDVLGSRNIRFGGVSDTSNFLNITNLDTAVQDAGNDAQFTVNSGPVQTRNTNEIGDAISGVTINLLATGQSTVTVSPDNEQAVENVTEFITAFNDGVSQIRNLIGPEGLLSGDSGIRSIEDFLRTNVFSQVPGVGDFDSLLLVGISTGEDFNSTEGATLELDEEAFLEALVDDRQNVEDLFSNGDGTGIADRLFDYLDQVTKATGFLNDRSKANGTIDQQITGLEDRITSLEDRLLQKEDRLRRQFAQLEKLSAGFQNQSAALGALGGGARLF